MPPGKANVILKIYVLYLTLKFNWESLFYLVTLQGRVGRKVGSGQVPCIPTGLMVAGCSYWSAEVPKDDVAVPHEHGSERDRSEDRRLKISAIWRNRHGGIILS